jgi:hypothetical protein
MSVPAPPPPVPPPAPPRPGPEAERLKRLLEWVRRAEEALLARRFNEAAGICQDVLESAPDYPPALAVLGTVLGHRGDLARATTLLEAAIAREPQVAAWHSTLSGLYRMQYRFDDAVKAAERAVTLEPRQARFQVNLGKALMDRGDRREAVFAFLAALTEEPSHPEAHLAIGQILLAQGEMKPGWIEYEWRNQLEQARGMLPRMAAPPWNGMALPGERILLVGDQGYGDTIQFARYIPRVAERCGEVVLGCSPDLARLLGAIPGVKGVYSRWDLIPPYRVYALLSSLPGLFGTELETIPAEVPYLNVPPVLMRKWAEKLEAALPGSQLRVGVAWAGRPTHPNDRRRSMRLVDLAPLAKLPEVALVSLQPRFPARDRASAHLVPLIDLTADFTDFAETAAAVVNLDLVVTVDTAVGHLAGALGKPVWLMLPTPSDWRWLLERSDSPWYPTMRLFRQERPGDWGTVVAAIAAELARLPRRF